MRVIAGIHKGTRIDSTSGKWMRPTTDRVRETLFSCLAEEVLETDVLDLFAGSGSLGIEALSRGARSVCFVDRSKQAETVIGRNIRKIGATAVIYRMTVEKYVRIAMKKGLDFDLVFSDPPYFQNVLYPFLSDNLAQLVKPGGQIIWESSSRTGSPQINGMETCHERIIGEIRLTFFRRNGR